MYIIVSYKVFFINNIIVLILKGSGDRFSDTHHYKDDDAVLEYVIRWIIFIHGLVSLSLGYMSTGFIAHMQ